MCKLLDIPRSSLYYNRNNNLKKKKSNDHDLTDLIKEIFKNSRNNYGSRKIKVELAKRGHIVSRRRIRRIMKKNGLVSSYTVKQYKLHKTKCNNDSIDNKLNRNFKQEKRMKVVVSDLTYVNVGGKWNYICLMLDLYNREIVGYAAGKNKNAELVEKALYSIKYDLSKIELFHSDRGSEFKNEEIEKALKTFNITRSLSTKGCPYDNAVAEATYKIIKTEFAFNKRFDSLEELELELFDYVNWYNNIRIHGSLDYKTPVEFRMFSQKLSKKVLTIHKDKDFFNIIDELRKKPSDKRNAYIIALYIGRYTGLRISEVFALDKNDFDFDNQLIYVSKKMIYANKTRQELTVSSKMKSKASKSIYIKSQTTN